MGELWARSGSAVSDHRASRLRRANRDDAVVPAGIRLALQLSRSSCFSSAKAIPGWAAWDIIRSVDFLYERPEIDKKRIILLGSVAGGGEIAGVAAALDPRITAVAPYNYDQGHVRVHGDSPGQIAGTVLAVAGGRIGRAAKIYARV